MDFNTLAAIAIAFITPSLAYYFGLRPNRLEARFRFKEARYGELLVLLERAYIGDTASTKTKKLFYAEYYKSWLYCSKEVITAMNDFSRLFEGNKEMVDASVADPKIEQIVLAMRRDLGTASGLRPGSTLRSFQRRRPHKIPPQIVCALWVTCESYANH